ncbi:MAG: efflux RND transporter periplasmic adaptor subunit [Burkholderiaceae bacterium]|nr:efflux RND transporter periplasmic adaptor subunit [Burkholderiaceae bacterium]
MSRTKAAAVLALVAVIAGGAYWWQMRAPKPAGDAASAGPAASGASAARGGVQTVGVVAALRQDVPVRVEASGTVVSLNTVDIRPQVSSIVREVLVKDGQMLKKGQPLFRFDDRGDRANLDKARAQIARDRATLADLDRQYKRALDLRAQNFIAQSAVDTVQSQLEAQRALLQSDEAALQSAQVSLGYNEIRSPLDGRAGAVNVFVGSLVQPSGTVLVSIAQINPIGVTFTLPETQLGALLQAVNLGSSGKDKSPLEAQIVLTGSAGRGTDAAAPIKGKVSFVDNSVDASSGSIRVKAEFDNSAGQLWPGQYVRLRLILRNIPDAVVVPQAAIILRGTERSIYVVGEDKTARLVPVQVRYPFGEMAVVEGIQAGDKVVLEGKQNLRPGATVRDVPATLDAGRGRRAASAPASGASK